MAQLIVNGSGETKTVLPSAEPIVETRPDLKIPTWREGIEETVRRQGYQERIEGHTHEVNIEIPTDQPYGIYATGDWHLWSEGFCGADFQRDMDLVLNQPNAGMILMGDEIDNFNWLPGAHEQLAYPAIQMQTLNDLAKEIVQRGKLIARLGGNHTNEWLLRNAGQEYFQVFNGAEGIPSLREGGFINLVFSNDAHLRILAKHRTRFNSSLNKTHANRRLLEKFGFADIVLRGHTHDKEVNEIFTMHDGKKRPVLLGVTGTYKGYDRYGMGLGYEPTDIGGIYIVYDPQIRKFKGFADLQEGIKFHNLLLKKI